MSTKNDYSGSYPEQHDYYDSDIKSHSDRHDYYDPDDRFAEPTDDYSATPEVLPEAPQSSFERTLSDQDEDDAKEELGIDGEAYNGLTKPDANFATVFHHTDVRGERWSSDYLKLNKESYFKMLGEINRGEKNGPKYEHSELATYNLRAYLTDNIGERLNLNTEQLREAKARATNVDGEKFGRRLELLVFCTCAYVVHRDKISPYAKERKFHPNCLELDPLFEEVAKELGLKELRIDRVCRRFDQEFSEQTPPRGFDPRKPGWKPDPDE